MPTKNDFDADVGRRRTGFRADSELRFRDEGEREDEVPWRSCGRPEFASANRSCASVAAVDHFVWAGTADGRYDLVEAPHSRSIGVHIRVADELIDHLALSAPVVTKAAELGGIMKFTPGYSLASISTTAACPTISVSTGRPNLRAVSQTSRVGIACPWALIPRKVYARTACRAISKMRPASRLACTNANP